MVEFAIKLKGHIDAKTIPDIEIPQMEHEGYCSYCKHRDKCKAAEVAKA